MGAYVSLSPRLSLAREFPLGGSERALDKVVGTSTSSCAYVVANKRVALQNAYMLRNQSKHCILANLSSVKPVDSIVCFLP